MDIVRHTAFKVVQKLVMLLDSYFLETYAILIFNIIYYFILHFVIVCKDVSTLNDKFSGKSFSGNSFCNFFYPITYFADYCTKIMCNLCNSL